MEYLSTKKIASKWNVSSRRVLLLASEGRIPGARQIDGRWFIPEDAEKPGDPRKKRSEEGSNQKDRFVFPYLLPCVHSEAQLLQFSEEEKQLYQLGLLFETGAFLEGRCLAEELLSSENLYVRIGALYYLPDFCMCLSDFEAVDRYVLLFRTALYDVTEHKKELDLLMRLFDLEMVGLHEMEKATEISDFHAYPVEFLSIISVEKLYIDVFKNIKSGTPMDASTYELLCCSFDSQGYCFSAMYMHLLLAAYYNNDDQAHRHLSRAVEIAYEQRFLVSLSLFIYRFPGIAEDILKDYPAEFSESVKSVGEIYFNTRDGYAEYSGRSGISAKLQAEDYRLILYCVRKASIEEMAQDFGLSRSGMNRRLSKLYEKLGVNSKKELVSYYVECMMNWG